jgi:hypothetical protein
MYMQIPVNGTCHPTVKINFFLSVPLDDPETFGTTTCPPRPVLVLVCEHEM